MRDWRIIFSRKICSAKIRHTAAQIESYFIYQVYGIEASDKEERDQMVELLLMNFPVMRATRRNGSKVQDALIDTRQLIVGSRVFCHVVSS